jgi:DNA invertase Pin-like site-specific DNA recombinase
MSQMGQKRKSSRRAFVFRCSSNNGHGSAPCKNHDLCTERLKCEKVFQEKISGARSDRKQLARLMAMLARGDVLIVTRLDRLARSTRDLLNLLGTIAEKGAGFRSLRDTWADTTTAHGRLMLTVLGGLAEFERELIRTRTGEGRERAKARGLSSVASPS